MTSLELQAAYKKSRAKYLKNKEREANSYYYDACRANNKAATQNRHASQRAD